MTELNASVALSLLPSWTWLHAAAYLRAGDPPADVLDRMLATHWRDQPHKRSMLREQVNAAVERAHAIGAAAIVWSDPQYPVSLTTIADPPFVLWVRGAVDAVNAPAVAIVGARAASPYGLAVAERLAADLARTGLVVISGLARGVDSAAHRGALSSGRTVAVLGSGIDVVYPPEHAPLMREIAACGAVVSEVVPGTPPKRSFFPLRNRIISGLSRAVVVIEAGEKSGSLITARCALEHGRDVLAVPGNVLSGRNRGGHALLRDGARIVESADDILDELGMTMRATLTGAATDGAVPDPIVSCLTPGEPTDLDVIAERSGMSPARLLP